LNYKKIKERKLNNMKIGILGSGPVGQVLGAAFADLGNEVVLGSRNPDQDKVKEWIAKTGKGVKASTFPETAKFGELVVLCTLWSATENVIKLANPKNFSGKTVIDATNPLDFTKGPIPVLSPTGNDSGGEQVQRWLPDSNVVKCFNMVGNAHMYKPDFQGGPPDMLICGNNDASKKKVLEILKDFGWPGTDLGGIEMSRYLEPLCIIWVAYGMKTNSWNHAFKMLRK
jgi:predicted dinucleotide-binding enzyme